MAVAKVASHPSDLSDPHYGYDVVVATTQASINHTMKIYLDSQPNSLVGICYVMPLGGSQPVQMSYEDFMRTSGNIDPFEIPADVESDDFRMMAMLKYRFVAGIRYKVGLPDMTDPEKTPDIVTLGTSAGTIGFNLLCSEFTICQYTPPGWNPTPTWFIKHQEKDDPWIFSSLVNIRQSIMDNANLAKLPQSVQDKIHNIGKGMFSVQQLLFDLSTPALESTPTISGVPSDSYLQILIQQIFINTYFKTLADNGQPLLGVSAVSTAPVSWQSSEVTNFDFMVSPYVNSQATLNPAVATLNYLCALNNDKLPPPVRFSWNWVEPAELADHDGVAVINRDTVTSWLTGNNDLHSQISKCLMTPETHCFYDAASAAVIYRWDYHEDASAQFDVHPSGPLVLSIDWYKEDHNEAGVNGDLGALKLEVEYHMTVNFNKEKLSEDGKTIIPSQIVVAQDMRFGATVRVDQSTVWGDPWHKIFTDTYTLGVNETGGIKVDESHDVVDKQVMHGANSFEEFFTGVNGLGDRITEVAKNVAEARVGSLPISIMQGHVFPGGRDFLFRHLLFSDNQDLLSYIKYAEPNAGPVVLQPAPKLLGVSRPVPSSILQMPAPALAPAQSPNDTS